MMGEGSYVNTSSHKAAALMKVLIIPMPLSAGSVLENDSIVLMVQFILTDRGTNPDHGCASPSLSITYRMYFECSVPPKI